MSFSRFRLPRTASSTHLLLFSERTLYLLYSFYVYCERIVRSWELIAPNATLFFSEAGLPTGWCFYYKDVSGLRKYLRMLRKCALVIYASRLRLNACVIWDAHSRCLIDDILCNSLYRIVCLLLVSHYSCCDSWLIFLSARSRNTFFLWTTALLDEPFAIELTLESSYKFVHDINFT